MTSHPIVVRPFNIPIRIGGLRFDIAGFGIAVLLGEAEVASSLEQPSAR